MKDTTIGLSNPERHWVYCFRCHMRLEAIKFEDSVSVDCPNCHSKNWFNADHGIRIKRSELERETL